MTVNSASATIIFIGVPCISGMAVIAITGKNGSHIAAFKSVIKIYEINSTADAR